MGIDAKTITAIGTALAGLAAGGGTAWVQSVEHSVCEANYAELMATHREVVMHLVEEWGGE